MIIDFIKDRFKEISTYRGIINILAGIAIWITPDKWDIVIETALPLIGITEIAQIENRELGVKKK